MNIEQVREYTLSLNGVTEDQPFGDDNITFRLEGKIFMCLWLGGGMLTFSTEETEPAQSTLPVVLTGLYVSGKSMPLDESLIVLGHKYGELKMNFSALNYAAPDYTRYR